MGDMVYSLNRSEIILSLLVSSPMSGSSILRLNMYVVYLLLLCILVADSVLGKPILRPSRGHNRYGRYMIKFMVNYIYLLGLFFFFNVT